MYLHLGGDIVINQEKIVVILDLDTSTKTSEVNLLPENLKNIKQVTHVSGPGKEKSLIITTEGYYLSPISSTTLMKRSLFLENQDD
ncbi:MAG: extracellular matrix regulator RemB [Desulfitobacteriaceae bacterium]